MDTTQLVILISFVVLVLFFVVIYPNRKKIKKLFLKFNNDGIEAGVEMKDTGQTGETKADIEDVKIDGDESEIKIKGDDLEAKKIQIIGKGSKIDIGPKED